MLYVLKLNFIQANARFLKGNALKACTSFELYEFL